MSDEFHLVQEAVAGRTDPTGGVPECAEACNRRLLRALAALREGGTFAPRGGALAALVRHAVRREQEKHASVSPIVSAPKAPPWPSAGAWERAGLDVLNETPAHLHVRARP